MSGLVCVGSVRRLQSARTGVPVGVAACPVSKRDSPPLYSRSRSLPRASAPGPPHCVNCVCAVRCMISVKPRALTPDSCSRGVQRVLRPPPPRSSRALEPTPAPLSPPSPPPPVAPLRSPPRTVIAPESCRVWLRYLRSAGQRGHLAKSIAKAASLEIAPRSHTPRDAAAVVRLERPPLR